MQELYLSSFKLKIGLARGILFVSTASKICELKNLALDFLNSLFIEGRQINLAATHKHLGVILSNTLRWSAHIAGVILKASQRIGLLCYMARNLQRDLISKLYLSYVWPCMEYASPVWHSGLTTSKATTLERLQARMARTILRAPWDTSKSIMLATLELPSLCWRRAVACMSLFHRLMTLKLTAGGGDCPFPDVIPFNTISTSPTSQTSSNPSSEHSVTSLSEVLPGASRDCMERTPHFSADNQIPRLLPPCALEEHWHDSKYYTHSDPFSSQS